MSKERELGLIKEYIKSVNWKFAFTMPKFPHQYTVKEWNPQLEKIFEMFVKYIRKYGYQEWFFKIRITYCDIDEYAYWTMGYPIGETVIINRKEKK